MEQDLRRFKNIVRGRVKSDIKKFLTNTELIGKKGKELVSIPLPHIDIPQFTFGEREQGGVGQGDGQAGDPVDGEQGQDPGKAGNSPGEHLLEVEITFEELAAIMGEALELPKIAPKGNADLESIRRRYSSIATSGPEGLRHFKRTYRQALQRQIITGQYDPSNPVIIPVREDRRYRTYKDITQPQNKAVVFFMLDVSGSMDEPNKLPLVKQAMQLLTEQLTENDRVAIVVYAGNSGLVLPPTRGNEREKICAAIAGLTAGGSTNGGQGIQLAYEAAQAHFVPGGTNRVILATDGDFNVGVTDPGDLVRLIEEKAAGGVGLSTLGFGGGNLKDATLEQLADRGNGNYAYIDTAGEARKVLVEQLCGTLVTFAKDVKLQIEFNPAQVGAYRLIGYENRLLREQDFNDDRKDAGEIGAGHTVTALYELVPAGKPAPGGVDALKYQRVPQLAQAAGRNELATLALRYKPPEDEKSQRLEHVITDTGWAYGRASRDFKFAASVAACGMLLRGSQFAGDATWDAVIELAGEGLGEDPRGYRAEFLDLGKKAKGMAAE